VIASNCYPSRQLPYLILDQIRYDAEIVRRPDIQLHNVEKGRKEPKLRQSSKEKNLLGRKMQRLKIMTSIAVTMNVRICSLLRMQLK
jgi:hypothetical protein